MSRCDQIDKAYERLHEGLSRIGNANVKRHPIDSVKWQEGKQQIMEELLAGKMSSNSWRIEEGRWVKFTGGYLMGTSFYIPNEEGGQEWLAKQKTESIRTVDSLQASIDKDPNPSSVITEKTIVESTKSVIKRNRQRKPSNIEVLQSLKEQLQR